MAAFMARILQMTHVMAQHMHSQIAGNAGGAALASFVPARSFAVAGVSCCLVHLSMPVRP